MPKKPLTQTTQEELNEEVLAGMNAQKTDLDKLWYYLNTYSLYSTVLTAEEMMKDPSAPPKREDYKSDEEYQRELEAHNETVLNNHLTDDEKESLQMPADRDTRKKISEATDVLEEDLKEKVLPSGTLAERLKSFKLLGILKAKIALDCGRDYEAKLLSLPEDAQNREDKAFYLHMKDIHSRTLKLSTSYKDLENKFVMDNGDFPSAIMKESPIPDVASIKKMTMGEFLDSNFLEPAEQDFLFQNAAAEGLKCSRKTTVFDFFKKQLEAAEHKKKQQNKGCEIREITDAEVYEKAKNRYISDAIRGQMKFGSDSVREGLSEYEKKLFDQGMNAITIKDYKPPKPIRDWVKTTGNEILRERRLNNLNDTYGYFGKEVDQRKPFKLESDRALKKAYGKDLDKDASAYDKFIAQHIGARAILDPPGKRREHLALVMAANAVQSAKNGAIDEKLVKNIAKEYLARDGFRKMSDYEVSAALLTKEKALAAQQKVLTKTFGVPKEEQAEYIRKMKALSEAMVPAEGQSAKYQAMKRSVDAIAKLDPKDPKTGEKLMLENGKLLGNLQTYTKGKKSKRFYSSSQARFDNSLDVLSVVDDHVPGMRQYADQIVKRTNEVRNVGPMDDDYVDLSEYGVKRAEWVAPEGTRAYDRKISAKADERLKEAGFDPAKLRKESAEAGPLNLK